jgi:tryptophanyl-tRNA synthetase
LSREVAAAWLTLGLDPTVSVLYRQSDVPEVCELAWLLGCVTAKGLLNRAHAYKAAIQDNRDQGLDDDAGVNAGLFTYPVLMAADILGHRADVVPVGSDQRQHVEITRDIATAFNAAFGPVLHLPDETVDEMAATIPGLDGRKMSKSYGNDLPVLAAPAELRARVMSIVTDSSGPKTPRTPTPTAFSPSTATSLTSTTWRCWPLGIEVVAWVTPKPRSFSWLLSKPGLAQLELALTRSSPRPTKSRKCSLKVHAGHFAQQLQLCEPFASARV